MDYILLAKEVKVLVKIGTYRTEKKMAFFCNAPREFGGIH